MHAPTGQHGRHVKVVGLADPEALASAGLVSEVLRELVRALGMRALGDPVMHDVELDLSRLGVEPFEDEGGVTGVVVLSTSHCAIHTWPARSLFVLDVYSCRDFDFGSVFELLKEELGVKAARVTDLTSSLEPPPAVPP